MAEEAEAHAYLVTFHEKYPGLEEPGILPLMPGKIDYAVRPSELGRDANLVLAAIFDIMPKREEEIREKNPESLPVYHQQRELRRNVKHALQLAGAGWRRPIRGEFDETLLMTIEEVVEDREVFKMGDNNVPVGISILRNPRLWTDTKIPFELATETYRRELLVESDTVGLGFWIPNSDPKTFKVNHLVALRKGHTSNILQVRAASPTLV